MKNKINKTKIKNYLNNFELYDSYEMINDDQTITLIINLGEKMSKVSESNLVLQKLDIIFTKMDEMDGKLNQISDRLDKVEKRLDNVENEIRILKNEAISHG